MNLTRTSKKYLRYIVPSLLLGPERTKEILTTSPNESIIRKDAEATQITVYDYNEKEINEHELTSIKESFSFKVNNHVTWINVDGIKKNDVEIICDYYDIHPLLTEDILSLHQRPKMDEVENVLFCLLNMLYFNEKKKIVEQEQVSVALGKDFVITFQEDPERDVFNPIREKLKQSHSKVRQRGADYLCYAMLDLIVDNYFHVLEKVGERIEEVEEEIIHERTKRSLAHINQLRKELIVLKRNIAPVRDLIAGIIRSESDLLQDRTTKYFKDVHDHIIQAYDLSENYRDIILSMQDLYINNINLRMNEVMKVMAIVTCLLAPATVIGGIFGMNFDIIPTAHNAWGFYTAVGLMLLIPVGMLFIFKQRGWF
jgi:magnesium transporter